ncbi:MAG: TAT-variant-translocated molybdopterin oxidoreductase [Planctomycetota bacterium]|nr:TAT-variant-translocated molybdopterin oxidoreductase [Planctomycetota bacterium]
MSSLNENLRGREYWRSLEHLASGRDLTERFEQEFPGYDPEEISSMSRRSFFKIMGAAMALAGLTLSGCRRWPEQEIRPHASQPEGFKPGVPVHYATIFELGGVATGLLVKTYDGRPIKVEGNTLHPYSRGATTPYAQASVLDVYDPDRSRALLERAEGKSNVRSWDEFAGFAHPHFAQLRKAGGKGLVVLSEPASGPTFARLKEEFSKAYPEASWLTYSAVHNDNALAGSKLAFDAALRPHMALDKAKIIACFEADILGSHPTQLKNARDWAVGRRSADKGVMNRLYAAESNFSITGAAADHRLPSTPSRVAAVLHALASKLGVVSSTEAGLSEAETKFVDSLAKDLQASRGASVVVAGASLSPEHHALVHAINDKLNNHGTTITFSAEPLDHSSAEAIASLQKKLGAGEVSTLVILGNNPAFDAAFRLPDAGKTTVIHLAEYVDETSLQSTWHLPRAHYMETWGDGRAWDGTISVQQPLILPLFDGKSPIELLAILLDRPVVAGLDLVRETFAGIITKGSFETAWRQILHDGLLAGSVYETVSVEAAKLPSLPASAAVPADGLEVVFITDYSLYDGRYANNGWLQEMPDPVTKLTWDNALLMGKAQADKLGIKHGDMVTLTHQDGKTTLNVAVYLQPGIAPGTAVLPLGYGRSTSGHIGTQVGFDAAYLRGTSWPMGLPWSVSVTLKPTGQKYDLVTTQEHYLIDAIGVYGRTERVGEKGQSGSLIREASLEEYLKDRKVFHRNEEGGLTLQLFEAPNAFNDPHAWGMAIDINSCIGCNACVIACQSENNIPTVGKDQVKVNREMHWIRIDRYYKGDMESPDAVYTPLTCVHCENAPCEQVCPVAATVHDTEGLNTMVYNRCIGTRYCSNNCPYKVRRFNYFDFHAKDPRGSALPWLDFPDTQQNALIDKIKQMVYNPDVTVRMRGVMEKCTYCTQRIQAAKISAKIQFTNGERENDVLKDGEVVTACMASCPTEAIVFGNLNDPNSRLVKLRKSHRNYAMLEELNIKPRTQFLAKVRNPSSGHAAADEKPHEAAHAETPA